MMKLRVVIALTVTVGLPLSACSNGKFTYGKALGDLARITGVTTGLEENIETTPPPPPVTAASGAPLIVGFQAIRVALPFAGDSANSKTYVSPDGVTVAMTDGFVTRATGLGIDSNGIYLPAASPWFGDFSGAAKAGASSDRVAEYWAKGRVKRDKYRCTLVSSPRDGGGTIIDETCKRFFESVTFVNRYWMTEGGQKECSRQWVHPQLAPLQFFATEQQAVTLDLTTGGC